jgi:mono/diheme cytochrome c family protein
MLGRRRWFLPALMALLAPLLLFAWTLTAVSAADQSPAPSASGGQLPGDPQKGATDYTSSGCSGCHGTGLEGGVGPKLSPIEKLPDTKDSLNPDYLITTITNGKAGVGGYGQMPAKGGNSKLTDQDVKDLAAFLIQSNRNPGATPLGPAELARSNVFWVSISILMVVLLTYLLTRYNIRWIARRAEQRRESERAG